MHIHELLDKLERIRDGLSDTDNRWGIEGTIHAISDLMNDIKITGVKNANNSKEG